MREVSFTSRLTWAEGRKTQLNPCRLDHGKFHESHRPLAAKDRSMFRPGTILNDTWEVKRRIGQGSFCELFLARNIVDRDAPMVAVKAQNSDIEASIIRVQFRVVNSCDKPNNSWRYLHTLFMSTVLISNSSRNSLSSSYNHLIDGVKFRLKAMSFDRLTTSHQCRSSIS